MLYRKIKKGRDEKAFGEVPERPIGPVSKTGVAATSPRVRIPPSPLGTAMQMDTDQREKTRFFPGFLTFSRLLISASASSFSVQSGGGSGRLQSPESGGIEHATRLVATIWME